eukprot:jgi/Phyca11/532261/estExt2_fgenesh1_pg.C_PHYCAscaffold_40228
MNSALVLAILSLAWTSVASERADSMISSRSGLRPWVDVDTPTDVYNITSSRGDTWTLVMSDEFNVPGRNFTPGSDHLWTALEMPDGVNAALEYYSFNMTDTVEESDGRGVFRIKVMEEKNISYTVWNTYAKPAGFETHSMYYRAGMVQTWNKFCFQGLGAYTSFVKYQVEWVMGSKGYIRWMVEDIVIFEIPAESIENVPQDDAESNPKKMMLEEPLYVIFNVALSTSWGTTPPNPGSPCRGDGSNAQHNAICDGFPMYMKIDYIRIYQDLSASSTMSIGCDPSTHPTKQWIEDHIDEYETTENKWIEVHGGANCQSDQDCTVGVSHISTGTCNRKGKCSCGSSGSWGGPRCTTPLADTANGEGFGPPTVLSSLVGVLFIVVFGFVVYKIVGQRSKKAMVGAGITQPAILSKIELDDVPRSNNSEDKVV